MANFAVLTFKYLNPKVPGAPDNYPAEVRPFISTLPTGTGWQLMTQAQLNQAKSDNQADFDQWAATLNVTPMTQNHEVRSYNSKGYVISETWYKTRVSSGVYTDKAREVLYTYDSTGASIIVTVENLYNTDGSIYQTITTNLMSDTSSPTRTVIFEKQ
jgi:hypothetical protein